MTSRSAEGDPNAVEGSGDRWRATAGVAALLGALILAGYGRIIGSYFLADDFLLIHNVLDGQGRADWSVTLRHLYSTQYVDTFRPVVTFAHTLAYALWGVHPAGYHALNLALHWTNALLLYTLARRMSAAPSRLVPLGAAALFATHPIHPEAVTYIGSLPVLACGTFYLLALGCVLRLREIPGRAWTVCGLVSFALALASKEEAISLPFAAALLGFVFPRGPRTLRDRFRAAMRTATPYAALLALYLGYRRLIFGRITPSYYADVQGTPADLARGVGKFLATLASPINLAYAGAWGRPVFLSVLAIVVLLLAGFAVRQRPRPGGLAFCAIAFLIFLIPLNRVVVLGLDPGLSNSRFLYLPSLAFAPAVALVIAGGSRCRSGTVLAAMAGYLVLHVVLLNVNNMAWADASALMETMQHESRRLTGNMLHVEVANIPDTVHGVFFDRGGYRQALIYPFVPDNALHRRERVVAIPRAGRQAPEVHLDFPEPDAIGGQIEPAGLPGGDVRVRVRFAPSEARAYRGEIRVRHPDCPGGAAAIAVSGRGTRASSIPTYVNVAIWPAEQFRERPDRPTYLAAVADLKDGIPAEEVSFSLLPGAPWRLRYFPLTSDWKREASAPVRIPDGEYRPFLLELSAVGRPTEPLVVPRVSALNAPTVMSVPGRTTIEVSTPLPAGDDTPADQPRRAAAEPPACAALSGIPAHLDFGVVPIFPQALRQDRPFSDYGQEPAVLFWDDLRHRLVTMTQVERAPVLFHASGGDLARWQRSPDLDYLGISPSVAALRASRPERYLETSDVDLPAATVAYAVLRMRLSGAPSPYARLSWKGAIDEHHRSATFVVSPDAYWHTYAIALHSRPGWRSTPRVRHLRLQPVLSEGDIEIESFDLIGPIP